MIHAFTFPLLATTLWGLNIVLLKALVGHMPAHEMNALRMLIAGMAFVALWQGRGWRQLTWRDVAIIGAVGLIGGSIFQWLLLEGIRRVPASAAAIVNGTSPAWVFLVGLLWVREKLGVMGRGGIALSILGVMLLGIGGGREDELVAIGIAFMVLAMLAWAVYTVAAQRFVKAYPFRLWMGLGYLIGMTPYWLLNLPSLVQGAPLSDIPPLVWLGVLASGIGTNFGARLAWIHGVRILGPTRTAVFHNLTPIVGVVAGFLLLHEVLPELALLAGAIVIAGIAVTQWDRLAAHGRSGAA